MAESQARKVQDLLATLSQRNFTGYIQLFFKEGGLERRVVQQEQVYLT